MTIVVIEDDAPVATLLVESLAQEGHVAWAAMTAREGLRLVDERQPDAVFLDLHLPDASGVEVLRQVRRERPDLPVIVLTGFADSPEARECQALGALDIIQKPTILANLAGALGKVRPKRR
jgi:CheY-like chemotaxis protein